MAVIQVAIQHRKNRQDVKRSSLWTKIIREVTVAAATAGRPAMIRGCGSRSTRRAGQRAEGPAHQRHPARRGRLEGASYEEIRYEGYGIAARRS